jgi:hypothetical protein
VYGRRRDAYGVLENMRERVHLEELDVDGRTMLKLIFRK